jgi:hypothetical protein
MRVDMANDSGSDLCQLISSRIGPGIIEIIMNRPDCPSEGWDDSAIVMPFHQN